MIRVNQLSERLASRRLFYGWVIVAITFTASMITAGISGYGLSFFILPMSQELGISRGAFSTITLFRLTALPLVPLLGLLLDKKHGPRLLLTFGSIVAGLTLMLTATVQTLWQFFAIYGVVFSLAMFTMGGQLVGPAVLSKWFIRKRGRVMAISAMGISGGGLIIAPMAGWLVGEFGWRVAWAALGLFMMLALSPVSALFMRRQPEDIGLLPDGMTPGTAATSQDSAPQEAWVETEFPWTVRRAVRTRALWVLLGVQSLGGGALMPILLHQVAYIQDKEFSLPTATAVATTLAGFAILGKLLYGFLAERVYVQWVLVMSLIPAGLSLLLLVGAQNLPMLYAYAVLHGLTMGAWGPLMNVAWAVYFGRRHMGAIRGVVTPVGNVMGAISPAFAGWAWGLWGSYDLPFTIFALAWILAGLLMLLARPPSPPVQGAPCTHASQA